MEEHWLTVDQLLALAAAEGFHPPEITARKIERWRKEGLLPRTRLIRLGRKGTRSEYPPETVKRLLALCRLRRRFPHDLDAIRLGLWFERYPLPVGDVKRSIPRDAQRVGTLQYIHEFYVYVAYILAACRSARADALVSRYERTERADRAKTDRASVRGNMMNQFPCSPV